jgi:ubiquinone/menaquinone biosynthesis C-methylase UbiE
MSTFDALASDYEAGRIGYSNDVYNALVSYGLSPKHKILDLGCGTGLASGPLAENDFDVTGIDTSEAMLAVAKATYPSGTWVPGDAEHVPFDAETFDAVISAQSVHHMHASTVMGEVLRVLKRGGIAAFWWKSLMSENPVRQAREEVAREMGLAPLSPSWRGSFREFYGAGFSDTSVRVIPWSTISPLEKFIRYERSRKIVRDEYGVHAEEYFANLEARLRAGYGEGDPILPLAYVHFLYLAKK